MKVKLWGAISSFIVMLCVISASSASWIFLHQPKEPKCLSK
jgi:cyclic lactone autoinducer peptide